MASAGTAKERSDRHAADFEPEAVPQTGAERIPQ